MRFLHELFQAFQVLTTHRLRTFLSTLGILCGVAAVVAMLSIGEGAKRETLAQIEQLGMNNIILRKQHGVNDQKQPGLDVQLTGLTEEDIHALQQDLPSLHRYAILKVVEAHVSEISQKISPEVLSVTPSFGEIKKIALNEGRFICLLDQKERKRVCVIGNEVAKAIGRHGHVGRSLRINHEEFQIIGVLKPTEWKGGKTPLLTSRNLDYALFIPLGTEKSLSSLMHEQTHGASEVIFQLHDSRYIHLSARMMKQVLGQLHGNFNHYQIIVPQELLKQANQSQRTFNFVLGSIAAISLLVGGIGIMNIMLATVVERRREIGVRRAIGANQRHIIAQFLLEAMILTFSGACLGILLGVASAYAISAFAGWDTVVTLWSIMLSALTSILVGLFSGAYPAYLAASIDPIAALRNE